MAHHSTPPFAPGPQAPAAPEQRHSPNSGLIALLGGALFLIVVGLLALPLISNRAPTLAPATTPEGVVQRFYQSAYAGDYGAAYAFVSSDTQRRLSLVEMQQQLSGQLQHSQVRVTRTTVVGGQATVWVTQSYVQPGGIFGSSEWSVERELLLQREGSAWKISGGPFVLSDRPATAAPSSAPATSTPEERWVP